MFLAVGEPREREHTRGGGVPVGKPERDGDLLADGGEGQFVEH
jgi:hypothetical protein